MTNFTEPSREVRKQLRELIQGRDLDIDFESLLIRAVDSASEAQVEQILALANSNEVDASRMWLGAGDGVSLAPDIGDACEVEEAEPALAAEESNWIWAGNDIWFNIPNSDSGRLGIVFGDRFEGAPELAIEADVQTFFSFIARNWAAFKLEALPDNRIISGIDDWMALRREFLQERNFSDLSDFRDQKWRAYRDRHCMTGPTLAGTSNKNPLEFWIVPIEGQLLVDVPGLVADTFDSDDFLEAVEIVCDLLLTRFSSVYHLDADLWASRQFADDTISLLRLFTDIDDHSQLERMSAAVGSSTIDELQLHQSEIVAFARMRPFRVPRPDVNVVFDQIERCSRHETPELDDLSIIAKALLASLMASGSSRPYEQGYACASWLRTELGLSTIVDPEEILRSWHVVVSRIRLRSSDIDAIGYWGPRHGPGVLLNANGSYSSSINGERATLAHEICHLLVDRGSALPLAEVLGGNVDEVIEQRARAFAAEFLLPQEAAYEAFVMAASEVDPERLIFELMRRYMVSKWIAGHQLKNSIRRISALAGSREVLSILQQLDLLVPEGGNLRFRD